MTARDAFRYINELDDDRLQGIIARLQFRAKDPKFTAMRDEYLSRIAMKPGTRVLDLGCGTGVIGRALARRPDFAGLVVGVDHSPVLIGAARELALEERVDDQVEFFVADVHDVDAPDDSFDVVIAHTTISHVADPLRVLREMARLVRRDGQIATFDGDYASWTFAYPDLALAKTMDEEFVAAIVNNPRIMRDLPRMIHEAGLTVVDSLSWVYAEVGTGNFHRNAAEAYGPLVARAGTVSEQKVEQWIDEQLRASTTQEFFAACNYYAYLICPT